MGLLFGTSANALARIIEASPGGHFESLQLLTRTMASWGQEPYKGLNREVGRWKKTVLGHGIFCNGLAVKLHQH
jgi:hypothetical protein